MSELNKRYEEIFGADAAALKADALKELNEYKAELDTKLAGGGEEPRAIAGPYNFSVSELIAQVEQETKVGRDFINAVHSLKATLAGRK